MQNLKWINKIHIGHTLDLLKQLQDECVNCVITSPPYWGLRDYGLPPLIWDGDGECEHEWQDHVRKPLGGCGSKHANVGANKNDIANLRGHDTVTKFCIYCGAWKGQLGHEPDYKNYIQHLYLIFAEIKRVLRNDGTLWVNIGDSYGGWQGKHHGWNDNKQSVGERGVAQHDKSNTKAKSLCQIPERFSLMMTDELGFIKRNTIIWRKPNSMPTSAKDRFTIDFEYIYFYVKNRKYWFKQQLEPHIWADKDKRSIIPSPPKSGKILSGKYAINSVKYGKDGRNKRCVWDIPTQPSPEPHFAIFPDKLVEPMIKAGCPEQGIVLDPFCGTGTTCAMAKYLNRNYIGFELNTKYVELAENKITKYVYNYKLGF